MQKLIVIDADEGYDDGYSGGFGEPRINVCDSTKATVEYLAPRLAGDHEAMTALLNNEYFRQALERYGYRDIKGLKSLEDKIIAEKRFFIYRNNGWSGLNPIDLEHLTFNQAEELARENTLLFQSVSKSSLAKVSPEGYKKYKKALDAIESAKQKKAEQQVEKDKKKKQKQLEEAKKLLEQEGLSVI